MLVTLNSDINIRIQRCKSKGGRVGGTFNSEQEMGTFSDLHFPTVLYELEE